MPSAQPDLLNRIAPVLGAIDGMSGSAETKFIRTGGESSPSAVHGDMEKEK